MLVQKFTLKFAAVLGTVMLLVAGLAIVVAHGATHGQPQSHKPDPLAPVRAATSRYRTLSVAQERGYTLLKDKAGIACIADPGVGAMGVHFVNGTLVNSGQIAADKPQALVYEPTADGQMHLVAVEYVVIQKQWDAMHHSPPMLFGQPFMLTQAGNRYGLPAFYSLHAWNWKANPAGMFSMWNPHVSCAATTDTTSNAAPTHDPLHHIPAVSLTWPNPPIRGPR